MEVHQTTYPSVSIHHLQRLPLTTLPQKSLLDFTPDEITPQPIQQESASEAGNNDSTTDSASPNTSEEKWWHRWRMRTVLIVFAIGFLCCCIRCAGVRYRRRGDETVQIPARLQHIALPHGQETQHVATPQPERARNAARHPIGHQARQSDRHRVGDGQAEPSMAVTPNDAVVAEEMAKEV